VDGWLSRLHSRLGPRYLPRMYLLVGLIIAAFVLAPYGVAGHYARLTFGQFLVSVPFAEVGLGLTLALGWNAIRGEVHELRRWESGVRDERSSLAAAQATFAVPRRATLAASAGVLLLVPPASVLGIAVAGGGLGTTDTVEIFLGGVFSGLAVLLLAYVGLELVLRPARRAIGLYELPHDRPIGFAVRLGVLLVCVPALGSIWVGGLQVQSGDGSLLAVYAASLGVVILAPLALGPLLAASVVSPIDDLIRGARSVARGDLDTKVALTTDDELGELTESFNRMVADLKARSEDLRASRARIVAASDDARRRVERDLHDGAQQSLVLLNLKLGLANRSLDGDREATKQVLAEARADLDRALVELRDLAHGIYPAALTNEGLGAALAKAAEDAAISTVVASNGCGRYPPEIEAAIYFCCLEAVQNAAKHAGEHATAKIAVRDSGGELMFEVRDDGAGFDRESTSASAGLVNMADRIGALGGVLTVISSPGQGTRVSGVVPIDGSPAA
jgi:signal transduction histidine kinase